MFDINAIVIKSPCEREMSIVSKLGSPIVFAFLDIFITMKEVIIFPFLIACSLAASTGFEPSDSKANEQPETTSDAVAVKVSNNVTTPKAGLLGNFFQQRFSTPVPGNVTYVVFRPGLFQRWRLTTTTAATTTTPTTTPIATPTTNPTTSPITSPTTESASTPTTTPTTTSTTTIRT